MSMSNFHGTFFFASLTIDDCERPRSPRSVDRSFCNSVVPRYGSVPILPNHLPLLIELVSCVRASVRRTMCGKGGRGVIT